MSRAWQVLSLVKATADFLKGRGIETARLDTEVLLADLLKVDRVTLYTRFDQPLDPQELEAFRARVKRRADREPVAYIIGRKEFWSRDFRVGPGCLIPRPDTETLIEVALERLPVEATEGPPLVLDLGTGPGTLAITLACERPCRAVGVDSSATALAFARTNAEALGVGDRVGWAQGDWWSAVPARFRGQVDLVVSNPPYLSSADAATLAPELGHEPRDALFSDPDPLRFYERTVEDLDRWLRPGGGIVLEVGDGQGPAVARLLREAGVLHIEIRSDLSGRPRVVVGNRPGQTPDARP